MPPDLLDLLRSGVDPETGRSMNASELRDNLLTFIVAGHETTALTLAWALYLVAFDPAVHEAAAIAASHPKWDERPLLVVVKKPGAEVTVDLEARTVEDDDALDAWIGVLNSNTITTSTQFADAETAHRQVLSRRSVAGPCGLPTEAVTARSNGIRSARIAASTASACSWRGMETVAK